MPETLIFSPSLISGCSPPIWTGTAWTIGTDKHELFVVENSLHFDIGQGYGSGPESISLGCEKLLQIGNWRQLVLHGWPGILRTPLAICRVSAEVGSASGTGWRARGILAVFFGARTEQPAKKRAEN